MPEFIFMLTHNDQTVPNALAVYEEVRGRGLRYIGFKDVGLPFDQLKELARRMHEGGQQVMLEVVSLTIEDELRAARNALDLGVDYLLGGTHAKEVTSILKGSNIRYYPFPGQIVGHPSILRGTIAEIVASAHELAALEGVHGLDLLAYRHEVEPQAVLQAVVNAVDVPVIAAGSINSAERIAAVTREGVWGFTIGSALIDGSFFGAGIPVAAGVEKILAMVPPRV